MRALSLALVVVAACANDPLATSRLDAAAPVDAELVDLAAPDTPVVDLRPAPDLVVIDLGSAPPDVAQYDPRQASFSAPTRYGHDAWGYAIAVADFNGDGVADVAVPYSPVTVFLGRGDGTLAPQTTWSACGAPLTIGVGDVNGDGKLDVVSPLGSDAIICTGNGDGTFAQWKTVDFGIGAGAYAATIADLDGDGRADLTFADDEGGVTIVLQPSPGNFAVKSKLPTDGNTYVARVGDVNGDGIVDVVAAALTAIPDVFIFNGLGGGNFAAPTKLSLNDGMLDFALTDFDGDGAPDLFVPGYLSGSVWVVRNNGHGDFTESQSLPAPDALSQLAVADFNLDGRVDVASVGENPGTIGVWLGRGDGTFVSGPTFAGAPSAMGLAAGDFNRDGKPDLATISIGNNTDAVAVILNTTP